MAAATFVLEGHYHRHIRGCGRSISAIWRFIPAGYGNFSLRNLYYAPERRIFTVDRMPEQVDMVCVARQLYRMKIQGRQARFSRLPANTVIVYVSTRFAAQRNLSRSTEANWRGRVQAME